MSEPTIYRAATVRTVDPEQPTAEAVAVDSDGMIVGVGTVDELTGSFAEAAIDHRYADAVIVPGFVEAHCHVMEGAMWAFPYVGFFGRTAPDGESWPGLTSLDAVRPAVSLVVGGNVDTQRTAIAHCRRGKVIQLMSKKPRPHYTNAPDSIVPHVMASTPKPWNQVISGSLGRIFVSAPAPPSMRSSILPESRTLI